MGLPPRGRAGTIATVSATSDSDQAFAQDARATTFNCFLYRCIEENNPLLYNLYYQVSMNQLWDEEYKNYWDERYRNSDFVYGKEPNLFFKEWLVPLEAGAILMPADGEGRNSVFAAQQGWRVTSCDLSAEGQTKALQLAKEQRVSLHYLVGDLEHLAFNRESFDAIGLIYAHFSAEKKSALHKQLSGYLKPGGVVILEAFGKNHLPYRERNPSVGGPTDMNMLYSTKEIAADFADYDILLLREEEIELSEGACHSGTGSVVRFVGRKRADNSTV